MSSPAPAMTAPPDHDRRTGPHPAPPSPHVIPLHLANQETHMAATRRTRTITHVDRLIQGPLFTAQQVIAAIQEAEQDDKIHPADVTCRMESGDNGAQFVVTYIQETVA